MAVAAEELLAVGVEYVVAATFLRLLEHQKGSYCERSGHDSADSELQQ